MNNITDTLFIALIAAVFLDAVTTVANLRAGARERNPLVRAFVNVFGPTLGLAISHGILIAALVVVHPTNLVVLTVLVLAFGRASFVNRRVARRL